MTGSIINQPTTEKEFVNDRVKILNAFNQYFELVPADTLELKEQVFKLRYQVYCLETGFENATDYLSGLESDYEDWRSRHYLIRHKATESYAATTRLILPDLSNLQNKFPIETHCEIDNQALLEVLPRKKIAEVSRFCVSKEFKRRKGEAHTLAGVDESGNQYLFNEDERGTFPHITLALIACLIKMSKTHNIEFWYAVMDGNLSRFLGRLGIHFAKIGPVIDYHGKRQPGIALVENILEGTWKKNPQVWSMLTNDGKYWDD